MQLKDALWTLLRLLILGSSNVWNIYHKSTKLQIRGGIEGGIEDNSKVIFLISQ